MKLLTALLGMAPVIAGVLVALPDGLFPCILVGAGGVLLVGADSE